MSNEMALTITERAALARAEVIPLQGAIGVYEASITDLADTTLAVYDHTLGEFAAWLGERGVGDALQITPGDLIAYRRAWQEAMDRGEVKPSTVGKKLVACRRFLKHCHLEGLTRPELTPERVDTYLKSPKGNGRGRLPDYLEVEEIQALLEAAGSARDRALITLALGSGLRVTELCDLVLGDLRPLADGGAILEVREGKGRKPRSFRIGPEVFDPVRAYVEADGRTWRSVGDLEAPLFQGWGKELRLTRQRIYQIVKLAAERALIQKPVHPHTLRHTFATHFTIAGGNPVALAEILGHANLDYVQTYTHLGRMITGQGYRATWLEGP